jgi:Domain of unknown function (DUF6259)/D-glucuronyl C5-epimerase, beta-sandwich domain
MNAFRKIKMSGIVWSKKLLSSNSGSNNCAKICVLLLFMFSLSNLQLQATTVSVTTDTTTISGYTHMLVPNQHGKILPIWTYSKRYPSGYQCMQFIAFYNSSNGNIYYIQTQDTQGRVIDWSVINENSTWKLRLTFYTMNGVNPGIVKDTSMTAANFTEFYKKVARKYKSWAINQFWAKRVKSELDKVGTIAITSDLDPNGDALTNRVIPYLEEWNGAKTACWSTYWRRFSFDTKYPDYMFSDSGYSRSQGMTSLSNENSLPILYMNGCLWDENSTSNAFSNPSNPDAVYNLADMVKDSSGGTFSYSSGMSNLKYVCQERSRWQTVIKDAWDYLSTAGAAGIYYDMAANASPKLCYDSNHSHDAGDPLVWQNGVRSIMQYIKDDGGIIISEGCAEIYIDQVDSFLTYLDTDMVESENYKLVPLFREVYGEVARTTGWTVLPSGKAINDLTTDIFKDTAIKAANFGSLSYSSPFFIGYGASMDIQDKLVQDATYASCLSMLTPTIYKQVYEHGMGADLWVKNGTGTGTASNIVDSETGTAAVEFDNSSTCFYLPIVETERFDISWYMKMSSSYYIDVYVKASDNNWYYLVYDSHARNYRSYSGTYVKVGLGTDTTDGEWRTIHRDLNADLQSAYPTLTVSKVDKVLVFADGLVDNITLSLDPDVYEDGASAADWTISGTGLSTASATDSETGSNVINFTGVTSRDGGKYFQKSISDNQGFDIAWDMKTSMSYYFDVIVSDTDGNWYYLVYDNHARDYRLTSGTYVKIGLGTDTTDGEWRTFRRNLADDLYYGAGKNIASVVKVMFFASGSIDNLVLYGNGTRSSGR